jgi:TRAP-type C4-dicarboxylate transport system permease small subunit
MAITYIRISKRKPTPVLEISSAFISSAILVSFVLISIYSVYFLIYDLRHKAAIEGGNF